MPREDRRLVCATSEDKERTAESFPDVELAALNTCWNAIKNLEEKSARRVMSYLYGRTLAHHALPEQELEEEEDF